MHFVLGRRSLRIFHQGVQTSKALPVSLLFPEPTDLVSVAEPRPLADSTLYNPSLNPEQKRAVRWAVVTTT